eukprot:15433585-Alexandrium_andersonii.AAC.1
MVEQVRHCEAISLHARTRTNWQRSFKHGFTYLLAHGPSFEAIVSSVPNEPVLNPVLNRC